MTPSINAPNKTTQGQTAPITRIKDILKEREMTQQNLADLMGVQLQSVKQMLNKESLRTDTLKRIADALNIPMWELFVSREEIMNSCKGVIFGKCPHCEKPIKIKTIIE